MKKGSNVIRLTTKPRNAHKMHLRDNLYMLEYNGTLAISKAIVVVIKQ